MSIAEKNKCSMLRISSFSGLNLRGTAKDGELSSAVNVTTDRFPFLTSRIGHTVQSSGYNDLSALYSWDELVTVDGTDLKYGGTTVAKVRQGEKQFALVGTRLIVWPDMICLDMTTGKCAPLNNSVLNKGGTVFAGSTVRIRPGVENAVQQALEGNYWMRLLEDAPEWTDGDWVDTGTGRNLMGRYGDPGHEGGIIEAFSTLNLGDYLYFIPYKTENGEYLPDLVNFIGRNETEDSHNVAPDESLFREPNTDGVYGVVTEIISNTCNSELVDTHLIMHGEITFKYDLYNAIRTEHLSDYFTVGDVVCIDGSVLKCNNVDKRIITAINGDVMTFADNTFISPRAYYSVTQNIQSDEGIQLVFNSEYYSLTDITRLETGDQIMLSGIGHEAVINLWHNGKVSVLSKTYRTRAWTDLATVTCTAYSGETGTVTASRAVPHMDYICESGGRLWGVSNTEGETIWDKTTEAFVPSHSRMIYASVPGDPSRFYDFNNGGSSSWQLQVESKGDFTGICAYSGSVLCWKVDGLMRITGSTAGRFHTYTYDFPGLQAGSYKSLAIVDEVLYYKSDTGVYAYSGTTPNLISYNLGSRNYFSARAGSDGVNYYICMKNADGQWRIFIYDTVHKIWGCGDAFEVKDFATMDGQLYMAANNCVIRSQSGSITNDEGETIAPEPFAWSAELAEAEEDTHMKKDYHVLHIRCRTDQNASLKAEMSFDGGAYETLYEKTFSAGFNGNLSLPIRPNYSDRVAVRLSGTGGVEIRAVTRVFSLPGEEQ